MRVFAERNTIVKQANPQNLFSLENWNHKKYHGR